MDPDEQQLKLASAESATALVADGMSLSSGLAVPPRSPWALGILVSSLAEGPEIDLTIDGTDGSTSTD